MGTPHSCDKLEEAFPPPFCILQAIKLGRPGNEASLRIHCENESQFIVACSIPHIAIFKPNSYI